MAREVRPCSREIRKARGMQRWGGQVQVHGQMGQGMHTAKERCPAWRGSPQRAAASRTSRHATSGSAPAASSACTEPA